MKVLVLTSSLDLSRPYGCTPAWWQLLKALHEMGVEVVATPYVGPAVESLWWRAYPNPCLRLGNAFARLKSLGGWARGFSGKTRAPTAGPTKTAGETTWSERWQQRLIDTLVKPAWRGHVRKILAKETDIDALLVLGIPLNHFTGLPTAWRANFRGPIIYFDGDLPASLPCFGGFASGFSIYHGADLSEYDCILSNSLGALETLRSLGARRVETVWWAADPDVFRPPLEGSPANQDIDVLFYGLGTEYREDWIGDLVTVPSRRLPQARFVVAGQSFDIDLGRAQRLGFLSPSQINAVACRAKINLNIARRAHASVYASATTRIFELAALGCTIVTNPLEGLGEWFTPGRELEVIGSADEATATYQRLLAQPNLREQLGRAARRRVISDHTYAHRAKQIVELLLLRTTRLRPANHAN